MTQPRVSVACGRQVCSPSKQGLLPGISSGEVMLSLQASPTSRYFYQEARQAPLQDLQPERTRRSKTRALHATLQVGGEDRVIRMAIHNGVAKIQICSIELRNGVAYLVEEHHQVEATSTSSPQVLVLLLGDTTQLFKGAPNAFGCTVNEDEEPSPIRRTPPVRFVPNRRR